MKKDGLLLVGDGEPQLELLLLRGGVVSRELKSLSAQERKTPRESLSR